jgi:hypothetical protein
MQIEIHRMLLHFIACLLYPFPISHSSADNLSLATNGLLTGYSDRTGAVSSALLGRVQ